MNQLANVTQSEYYSLQGTPSPLYREPREMQPGSNIVCSKTLIKDYARSWTLKGSRVFHKVNICEYGQGTLRIDGDIQASFIKDNFEFFKTELIPQFGEFGSSFFFGQINSGVPKPVKEIRDRAEAFLNVVCKVEGLAIGSFQFMYSSSRKFLQPSLTILKASFSDLFLEKITKYLFKINLKFCSFDIFQKGLKFNHRVFDNFSIVFLKKGDRKLNI